MLRELESWHAARLFDWSGGLVSGHGCDQGGREGTVGITGGKLTNPRIFLAMNAFTNRQVLLVENDSAVRESLRNALEMEGVAVCAIPGDGETAHRFAAGCYDLVLMDLATDGRRERQLMQSMRNINPDVKLIIISAVREAAQAALAAGAWQAFEKPLRLPELLKSIQLALIKLENGSNISSLSPVHTAST